jgi:glycosyltransferase involved in cell wall biosynthesis
MAARTIAYLSPLYFDERSYIGGGERHPLNLARGVAATGSYRVEFISFGPSATARPLAEGVTLRVLTAAQPLKNPLDVLSWELPEALAGADLVHIHQAYTRCSEMGLLIAKQQRKPICVTDHGGNSSTLGEQLGVLELADLIIPNSDFGASLFRTRTPIVVIKGGVDGTHFAPPPARPRRDRALYVGRLLPHKGIDRLLEAIPDDLPLTVCGRPTHDDYFRRLQALARGKAVEFVTDADDATLLDLYARAFVTVLPSVYQDCYGNVYQVPELMGLTLLESMACGTPVICSRVGGMPEFVREGATGFVFDTPDELTRHLRALAADPGLVERLGRQARRDVEGEYDLHVAGARLAGVYDELLARRREVAA